MGTTNDGQVRFRDATTADLRVIARLHRRAYSGDHFLTRLPETVLADYYARFLGDGSQIVLAVRVCAPDVPPPADELLGFAVFGRHIESRIAEFKRARRMDILQAALGHPILAARKLLGSVGAWRLGRPPHAAAPVLLLSIAVGEAGKGVGRALLEDVLRSSAHAGEARIGLYVRHENVTAINAYLRVGFRIVESIQDQYYMEHDLVDVSRVRDG